MTDHIKRAEALKAAIDGAEDFTCGNHNAECSICRCYVSWDGCDEDFNYCPNCGAKMDGGFDDATS